MRNDANAEFDVDDGRCRVRHDSDDDSRAEKAVRGRGRKEVNNEQAGKQVSKDD